MTYTPPVMPELSLAQTDIFPNNIANALEAGLANGLPQVTTFLRRPLRTEDPSWSVGVYATDWQPNEIEIGTIEPDLTTYTFQIQTLVKSADEEEGRQWGAYLAKSVRLIVYRSNAFAVPLRALKENRGDGSIERYQRHGIKRQRFAANVLQAQFLQFSSTELWVQTESMG